MMRLAPVILGCVALATVGCDTGDGEDAGDEAADDGTMMLRCASEDRAEDFHLGLEKDGTAHRVTFTDAEPAEPIRGLNTWTIALSDLEGAPMEGMELSIVPWMPDHGHGSPQPVEVTDIGEGQYTLDPVNLFMAGYWEVTISAADDEIMLPLCVE